MKLRKPEAAKPGEINYAALDRFTVVHFCIGIAYSLLGLKLAFVAVLAIGWEIIENPIKFHMPFLFPHGTSDTWRNAIADIIAVFAGWMAMQALNQNGIS